ncbi:basic proline-rich protein-like [Amblyraja radiata]|uniref:basic proline-rich protein-like n=1 Tax=Amblyraja radiata TaxID=386614 RepID=UPI0014024614|nr:basic proline-rich protein-like [Amblyraja radiata]
MTTAVRTELERWFEETQAIGLRSGGGLPFWYHGLCSRREADRLLQGRPVGSYLLRLSQSQGGLVLSYSGVERCRHFIVQEVGGQYVILGEERRHRSVAQLLDYHRLVPIPPWTEHLTSPCLKRMERCYEEISGTLDPERNSRDPSGGADDVPDRSGGETEPEPGESPGVGMNPTGGRQRVERCYEEIAGTLAAEPNSRDPGGGADGVPDRPAGETDMESGLQPRHSVPVPDQMPDGHYEEIREIQKRARRLESPAGIPGQSVGLGSDSLPAGGVASGNGGGYQEIPDGHYEEIREIQRRARRSGLRSGIPGQSVGPGSDSLPAGGNDGGYQEMSEVHGSTVRESGRSCSPRRGAETRGPVPTPPAAAYATVNKAGAHVYTEPGEGGPRATAQPFPGHEYSELEPQRARPANHYCPDPTTLTPGARTLPGNNRSLRPTSPTFDLTARPLPDPDRSLRPTTPTLDLTARPLPNPNRPTALTPGAKARTLPNPNRSLRPTGPTSDPTGRSSPDPNRRLWPSTLTRDPAARPLPDPKSLRPFTPSHDPTARPLPNPDRSLQPSTPTLDPTVLRPLPDPNRSPRPTTPTLDPTVRPLPDPDQSLRPATLTYEPMDRPTPHPSLRPAAPAGEATPPIYAQPARKRRGQNGPGPTGPAPGPIQLDDVAYGVLSRPAASTPRPGAGRAENRPRAPATRAKPVPRSGEVPPRPGPAELPPRPGPAELPPRPGPAELPPRPGPAELPPRPGPAELPPRPGPAELPPRPGPAELPPRPGPVEVPPRLGPVENKPRLGPMEVPPRLGPVENKPRLGPMEVPPRLGPVENKPRLGPMEVPPRLGPMEVPPRPVPPAPRPTPVTPETGGGGGGGARPASSQDGDLYETILEYQRPTAARPVCRRGRN